MGLNQYLSKKTYVQQWTHQKEEERFSVEIKRGGVAYQGIEPEKVSYIVEAAITWRKSNQIHQWFVQNVQDGEDDCKEYYVSVDKLKELLELCNQVVADPTRAEELLPVQGGFFFGSTEYDDWYMEDIRSTQKGLIELTEKDKGADYYYQSSW